MKNSLRIFTFFLLGISAVDRAADNNSKIVKEEFQNAVNFYWKKKQYFDQMEKSNRIEKLEEFFYNHPKLINTKLVTEEEFSDESLSHVGNPGERSFLDYAIHCGKADLVNLALKQKAEVTDQDIITAIQHVSYSRRDFNGNCNEGFENSTNIVSLLLKEKTGYENFSIEKINNEYNPLMQKPSGPFAIKKLMHKLKAQNKKIGNPTSPSAQYLVEDKINNGYLLQDYLGNEAHITLPNKKLSNAINQCEMSNKMSKNNKCDIKINFSNEQ